MNGRRIIVWWQHPRYEYANEIADRARQAVGDGQANDSESGQIWHTETGADNTCLTADLTGRQMFAYQMPCVLVLLEVMYFGDSNFSPPTTSVLSGLDNVDREDVVVRLANSSFSILQNLAKSVAAIQRC